MRKRCVFGKVSLTFEGVDRLVLVEGPAGEVLIAVRTSVVRTCMVELGAAEEAALVVMTRQGTVGDNDGNYTIAVAENGEFLDGPPVFPPTSLFGGNEWVRFSVGEADSWARLFLLREDEITFPVEEIPLVEVAEEE